jgi:tripartite-type tricarboxylate transporter receptor subunit TctC
MTMQTDQTKYKRSILKLAGAALMLASTSALLAQTYPSRVIKIVVPQGAGSMNDVIARSLGEQISKSLGQPVVVENKTGANGALAAAYTLSQPADGYTLFFAGVSNMSWNPLLYKTLGHVPERDFTGVAMVGTTPFFTLVAPSLGVRTLADLIKKAKAEPGKISFASAGVGNSTHLSTELLMARTGMQLQHVPFGPATVGTLITSLMTGQTPVMTTVPGGISEVVKGGKLLALAVTGDTRLPDFPELPTFKELGFDVAVPGWLAVVARTGTPEEIVQRLNAEINRALDTAEMKKRFAAQFLEVIKGPPSEVMRLTKRDADAWKPLIEQLNIAQ